MMSAKPLLGAAVLLTAALTWAQEGKVHQPVKYKHVYLEEDPRSKIALEFFMKTNCAGDSLKIEDFSQMRSFRDESTGRLEDIRVVNVYATLLPDDQSCKGEKVERRIGVFKVPPDMKRKTRLYITLEGWLTLRVDHYR